jgi:predicted GNAT family acetyltransferase
LSCSICADKGIAVVNWSDAPREFAVCVCPVGKSLRETQNAHRNTPYARWQVWAAREGIDPGTIHMLEDVLTDVEWRERGLGPTDAAPVDAVAAAAAARGRKVRL